MTLSRASVSVKPFSRADSNENILRLDWARTGPNRQKSHWNRTLFQPSDLPVPDRESRQMARDIAGIERWPGENADGFRGLSGLPVPAQRRVVEVRPEHAHGRLQCLGAVGGLPPAHHLRVQPGSLYRLRPCGALPPHQEIAATLAHGAV